MGKFHHHHSNLVRVFCLLFLLTFLTLGACTPKPGVSPGTGDSLKTQAWKILMTDKQLYDKTFQALALLDKQGKLPAEAKAKAIRAGNLYMSAHNMAVQTLLDGAVVSLTNVQNLFKLYIDVVSPYTVGVN
jgi:hypothetical protein